MDQDIKELVLRMYYEEKILNATKIAQLIGINPKTAQRYVSRDSRYQEYKEMRKREALEKHRMTKKAITRERRIKEQQEKEMLEKTIIKEFFKKKCIYDNWEQHTEKKLSDKYNITLDKITRILKKNEQYQQLQEWRKISDDAGLEIMHRKDVCLMSKSTVVSNHDILKYLKSAYSLSIDSKKYIYNDKVGAKPHDLPNTINNTTPLFSNEKQRIDEEKFSSEVESFVIKC